MCDPDKLDFKKIIKLKHSRSVYVNEKCFRIYFQKDFACPKNVKMGLFKFARGCNQKEISLTGMRKVGR